MDWTTSYRGWIAIHSGRDTSDLSHAWERYIKAVNGMRDDERPEYPNLWPLGRIVAIARVVGTFKITGPVYGTYDGMGKIQWDPSHSSFIEARNYQLGGFRRGRHVWQLRDAVKVKPEIEMSGALGLWKVPAPARRRLEKFIPGIAI